MSAGTPPKASKVSRAFVDRQTRSPEEMAYIKMAVHGIDDTYRCPTPGCGRPYEDCGRCRGCNRPHQHRCGITGCGVIIHPTKDGDLPPYCQGCLTDRGRRARAETFGRCSSIPPRERQAAQMWSGPRPQQSEAVKVIEYWLQSPIWKRTDVVGIDSIFLAGLAGRGKSVVAAYAVKRAFVELALVSAFHWETQTSLEQLFAERHARGTDAAGNRQEAALNRWRTLVESPLLVLDDLFTKTLTPAFGEALASLIRDRLDQRRPMIITSNKPAAWNEHFEDDAGRIASRWQGYGHDMLIAGEDLRVRTT